MTRIYPEKECPICGTKHRNRGRTCSRKCTSELQKKTIRNSSKELNCRICEEPFRQTRVNQFICDKVHYRKCAVCGKDYELPYGKWKESVTCGPKCGAAYTHTDESREKRRQNNLEKYGVEYTFQREEVKDQIYASEGWNNNKFGSENFKKAMMKKYGVENIRNHPDFKSYLEAGMMKNHGVTNVMLLDEFKERLQRSLQTNDEDLVKGKKSYGRISKNNINFANKLKEIFGVEEIIYEYSMDGKHSLDLYLPKYNLGIELNPTFTHNVNVPLACVIKKCDDNCTQHKTISRNYHLETAKVARSCGINLLQIYTWNDESKIFNLIEGKIREGFTKISARKCVIKKIDQKEANLFIEENHYQGASRAQSHCYGLFYEGELVAASTFSKPRFNDNYEYEFNRYAVKKGFIIHGASGKLFKEFLKEANPNSIISYVNYDHTTSEKTFLNTLGFTEIKESGPSLIWSKYRGMEHYKGTSLLRIGADRLLGTSYGSIEESGLNNTDIMFLEGFLQVYNSGNRVFVWEKEPTNSSEESPANCDSDDINNRKTLFDFTDKNISKDGRG